MKVTPGDRAVAFALLLSLHKYARWLSSLRSSRPLSAASAGKELQAMAQFRSYFPGLSKKIKAVLLLHLELIGCVAAATAGKPGRSLQTPEFLALVTRQGEAVARLTAEDLDRMRAANRRFAAAIADRDTAAALAADDDFHAVTVQVAGNRALATVLDQFSPVVRRLERLRFASLAAVDSVALHDRLVAACEAGDPDAAADVAFRTWQNLADLIPDTAPDQQETP